MHLKEPPERPSCLRHVHLKLGQQTDEPLEALLLPVDPEEVYLFEGVHHPGDVVGPSVVTARTGLLDLLVPVGDALEDGGEGGDPDPSAHQDRVLRPVNVAARGPEGAVHHDLQRPLGGDPNDGAHIRLVFDQAVVSLKMLIEFVGPVTHASDVDAEVVGILGGGADCEWMPLKACNLGNLNTDSLGFFIHQKGRVHKNSGGGFILGEKALKWKDDQKFCAPNF